MNEENNKLPLLILLVLGVITTVIISIYCFVGIWSKKAETIDDKTDTNNTVGTFNISYNKSLTAQVNEYADDIFFHIGISDVNWLFENLDKGYVSYKKYDINSFKEYLNKKGILGKTFKATTFTNASKDDNRIILVQYSDSSTRTNGRLVIIEYSPNNYGIAFDDYVYYNQASIDYKNLDLDISIKEQTIFAQSIKMKVSITNNSDYTYCLNYNKEYEMFSLVFSDDTKTEPIIGTSVGNQIMLEPRKTLNYNLEFSMSDIKYINYKKLIIKDVKNMSTNTTENFEITF